MSNNLVLRQKREQRKQVEEAVREHGKTTPMKLEGKRLRLSQTEQLMEVHIGMIQGHRHALDKEKKLTPEIAFQLDMAVLDLRWKSGVINGLGSIVDCLTMRTSVTKKGKKGYARFSLAWYLMIDQRFDELDTIVESLKKLSGYVPPPDEDGEGEEIADEEIEEGEK